MTRSRVDEPAAADVACRVSRADNYPYSTLENRLEVGSMLAPGGFRVLLTREVY